MVFPKPVSAKTRARLSLARIISEMGDLYGSEISGFELEIGHDPKELDVRGRQEKYRGQFLKIFVSQLVHSVHQSYNPTIHKPYPVTRHSSLDTRHHNMIIIAILMSSTVSSKLA